MRMTCEFRKAAMVVTASYSFSYIQTRRVFGGIGGIEVECEGHGYHYC